MTERQTALRLVAAFHQAVDTGQGERLLELVSPDVELGGPRGTVSGAPLLVDCLTRSGIRLRPGRVFARGGVVVVEQEASWPDPSAGPGGTTPGQMVATVFTVRGGRLAGIVRHDEGLATALAAAGLGAADEVPAPS